MSQVGDDAVWDAITLKKKVEPDLAADLEKNGAYVSPEILGVKVDDGVTVRFAMKPGTDVKATRAKVDRYLDAMVTRFRQIPKKVIHTRKRKDQGELGRGAGCARKGAAWWASAAPL